MFDFFSVSVTKKPEISLLPVIDQKPVNNDILPSTSFQDILNKQIVETTIPEEQKSKQANDADKISSEKETKHQIDKREVNAENADHKTLSKDDNTKSDEKTEQPIDNAIKEKNQNNTQPEKINHEIKTANNTIRSKETFPEGISKIKEKKETEKEHKGIEPSLLKDIFALFDAIKSLIANKKEFKELKSVLADLKEKLSDKNEFADNKQVKNLFNKLRELIKTIDQDNGKFKIALNMSENKLSSIEFDLKKQISNLTEEIKKLIEKKPDNPAAKIEDIVENKNNPTHKIIADFSNSEKKEIHNSRENQTNFSFQFSRKDQQSAEPVKNTAQLFSKNNLFDEQLNKIIGNAKLFIKDSSNGSFSIKLYPESLGKINVNLNLESGTIFGKFLVDNNEAKDVLLENMNIVKDRLQESGISVGEFQVNVRNNNASHNANDNNEFAMAMNDSDKLQANEYEIISRYTHNGEIDILI